MEIAPDEYWPIAAGSQELVVARRMRGAEWLYQDAQPSAQDRGLHVMQEGKAGGAAVEEGPFAPILQEVAPVSVKKTQKVYICCVAGCDKRVVKNKRCYKHNRQLEKVSPAEMGGGTGPAPEAPAETEAIADTGKGLEALLLPATLPPVGLLVPFSDEELAMLEEKAVTAEHVRQLVLMGIAGRLQPVKR